MTIDMVTEFDEANFDEATYLATQPDVRAFVEAGHLKSGRQHFDLVGRKEKRSFRDAKAVRPAREAKMARLRPFLRTDMPHVWADGRADYLTPALRAEARIADTDAVSSNGYDGAMMEIVTAHPDGLILDCGAGSRSAYHGNVVNFEIVAYPSTDVLGIGETLPFVDGTFDAVFSVAVLEHVRDPFRCAAEIARVLKPGGQLYCSVPFLQPFHGYPHHYFNATPQGIRALFEDRLSVHSVEVLESTHPVWALSWILGAWEKALPAETRRAFRGMTVAELVESPEIQVVRDYCRLLPRDAQLELACATVLRATKPA